MNCNNFILDFVAACLTLDKGTQLFLSRLFVPLCMHGAISVNVCYIFDHPMCSLASVDAQLEIMPHSNTSPLRLLRHCYFFFT